MRESVQRFARQMERILRKNDHKLGWDDLQPYYIIQRIEEEVAELKEALTNQRLVDAKSEAIDVANFAMMIWDVLRRMEKNG